MAPADSAHFGEALRRLRLAATLSQDELADRAGLSRRGISDLERGARRPHSGTVRRLADALGLGEEARAEFIGNAQWRPRPRIGHEHSDSNLPVALSSFVGREREMEHLHGLLSTARLLTLTGTGGVGKTRLAIEASRCVADAGQRVCLVELAPITECSAVPRAVAAAVGVADQAGHPPIETLKYTLRNEQLLLILDNCEQVLQACAELADAVLGACPKVRILATSRERLGIAGETVWRVPSLTLPSASMSLEDMNACDATRLFVQRAAALAADFVVSEENASAVVNLCTRLDGIPLAIELAAAQLPALSVQQIAARLDDALRLLVRGNRSAPLRQQTLEATIAWSYALLDPAEQLLFDRLSVFAGGWTLEAAEQVCSDSENAIGAVEIRERDVVNLLAQLVSKSLVVAEPGEQFMRYHLLETLRQYAAERLEERAATEPVRRRHAVYYTGWAEHLGGASWGPDQAAHRASMERERDNIRAAVRWLIDHGEAEYAQRLTAAVGAYWQVSGRAGVGRAWISELDALPARSQKTAATVRMFNVAANLAMEQGDYTVARSWLERALELARELGDERGTALALFHFAHLAWYRREFSLARTLAEQGAATSRRAGLREMEGLNRWQVAQAAYDLDDPTVTTLAERALAVMTEAEYPVGIGIALTTLGQIHLGRGELGTARAVLERALAAHPREVVVVGRLWTLCNLGWVATEQGDLATAHACFLDGLVMARDALGRARLAMPLEGLAQAAAASGQAAQAFRLAGAAATLRETHKTPPTPSERARLERWLARARASISARTAEQAWETGRRLIADEAIAEALAVDIDAATFAHPRTLGDCLTSREREVATLVAEGFGTREIAELLVIAEGTVRVHVERILSKLGLHSRTQLAAWAAHRGPGPTAGRDRYPRDMAPSYGNCHMRSG